MGFFGSLFGSDQAKAAKRASRIVSNAEKENKQTAIDTRDTSIADLESYLAQALGQYESGQEGAVGALSPYSETGGQALSQIAALMGLSGPEAQAAARAQFTTDPGYEFRLSEGIKTLDNSAAANGSLYSGRQLKALNDYGQNMASEEYGNYFSRLSDLAGRGQTAATNIASTLSDFAKSKASAYLGTGENIANTRLGALSAITGANTGAATATATGIKQAADAKAAGAGNLLSTITGGIKLLSGFA